MLTPVPVTLIEVAMAYWLLGRLSGTPVAFRNFDDELNTIEVRFRNSGYLDPFLLEQDQ